MADEIHVGDTGTIFKATISDASSHLDISGASTKLFYFSPPDIIPGGPYGVQVRTPTLSSTANYELYYTSVQSDLFIDGEWKLQAYVEFGSGKWHTDVQGFTVYPNLA